MAQEGTVVAGTHHPEDLIPALTAELEGISPKTARAFRRRNRLDYARLSEGREPVVSDRDIRTVPALVRDLMDALDDRAPDGLYFGAHPNDGSDFGYWRTQG